MNHIDGETLSCALLGHPAGHTLSPKLHNLIAHHLGVNMVYTAYDVEPDRLKQAVKGADALGFTGMNVTIPYKQEIIPLLKSIDKTAEKAGAVNTLVRRKKGKGFKGYNTDLPGLMRALASDGVVFRDRKCVVLGAGGAARAVCTMLAMHGASRVIIVNRTITKARELAQTVKKTVGFDAIEALTEENCVDCLKKAGEKAVCFQCTSAGMYPETEQSPVTNSDLYQQMDTAVDLIYNPQETKFLRLAREAGAKGYNGLKMLLYQGIISFELWYDRMVPNEVIDEAYGALLTSLTNKKTIVLIGFMGSGKSTVASVLADKLDELFVDMDAVIESKEKDSITNIIEGRGEPAFREMETKVLRELTGREQLPFILSTGGGVPISDENRKLLHSLGTVVYLKTCPEEVYRRIKDEMNRPLLKTDDPYRTIVAMEEAREEFYNLAADLTIVTDSKTPGEIVDEIIEKVFPKEA